VKLVGANEAALYFWVFGNFCVNSTHVKFRFSIISRLSAVMENKNQLELSALFAPST
jgi:hypothetical protein